MMNMIIVWLFAVIALSVAEALTYQLVSIWFAIGGVGAFIAAVLGAHIYIQVGIFVAVSLICLFVTRPLAKKLLDNKVIPTNSDSLIGKEFIVYKTIDNKNQQGQIKVNDVVWTARSGDDSVISEGDNVFVERIDGVKLIVKKC